MASPATLALSVTAGIGERHVPWADVTEATRPGDLVLVEVMQWPPAVETAIPKGRGGIGTRNRVRVVVPAVALVAAVPCLRVVTGVVLLVGSNFRYHDDPKDRDKHS
jgi:hypothetical protein